MYSCFKISPTNGTHNVKEEPVASPSFYRYTIVLTASTVTRMVWEKPTEKE